MTEIDGFVVRGRTPGVITPDNGMPVAPELLQCPGESIKDELDARGWTQKDLAEIMGRPTQAISEIVNGAKQITPDTAMELAAAFGQVPDFWMRLEASYRLGLAQAARNEQEPIKTRARIREIAPVRELLRRGWIASAEEPDVCRFLGVASIWEEPAITAALRASLHREPEIGAIAAWLRRVEQIAAAQDVGAYDALALRASLPDLAALSVTPANVTAVPSRLAALGVRFAYVPHLERTFLDGASLWVAERPTVAMTLRHDRIDNFWFTLLHELAHIVLGHPETIAEEMDPESRDPREVAANTLAQEVLVAPEVFERVADRVRASGSVDEAVKAAAENERHPGIVIGRLQHAEVIGYHQGRTHLSKVRTYLAPIADRVAA